MAIFGESNRVLFSTQTYQSGAISSTGTIVAKITAAQFSAVSPSAAVQYHVTWVPGAQSSGTFLLMQANSTTLLDPTNAGCRDSMWVQTLAGQSWNYDAFFRIEIGDCLTVHMPNSSGATGVAVKLYAEALI